MLTRRVIEGRGGGPSERSLSLAIVDDFFSFTALAVKLGSPLAAAAQRHSERWWREREGRGKERGCKVLKPARRKRRMERERGDCKNIAWLEMLHLPRSGGRSPRLMER